jgi:hypothetical protein
MVVLTLKSLAQNCSQYSYSQQVISVSNPPLSYDNTLGNPNAQNIIPPYPNMVAHIDDINGAGSAYVWNPNLGQWK